MHQRIHVSTDARLYFSIYRHFLEPFFAYGFQSVRMACIVCLDTFSVELLPRILPCGHTLCTNCLETIIKGSYSIKCPLCNAPVPGTHAQVVTASNFAINHAVLAKIKGEMDAGKFEDTSLNDDVVSTSCTCPRCSSCLREHNASSASQYHCGKCDIYLCRAHSILHASKSSTLQHSLLDLGACQRSSGTACDMLLPCPQHALGSFPLEGAHCIEVLFDCHLR